MATNTFSDTVLLQDNTAIHLGTDGDGIIQYDETTDDRVEVTGAAWHFTPAVELAGTTTVSGTPSFTGGVVNIGEDDTTAAILQLYGSASSNGGTMRFYTSGNADTNVNWYEFISQSGDLTIRTRGGTQDVENIFYYEDSAESLTLGKTSAQAASGSIVLQSATTQVSGEFILDAQTAPSSASDTGTAGMVRWDSSYIYICVASNTWERAAIATW